MKKLIVKIQISNLTVASVPIPFKIEIDQAERYETYFKSLFKSRPWWRSWLPVDIPGHTANGHVDFFDVEHGHLDHGNIIQVPLKARRCWPWGLVEISGVTNPIGRWCWSGWGIMILRIVGPALNFEVGTPFPTVITS